MQRDNNDKTKFHLLLRESRGNLEENPDKKPIRFQDVFGEYSPRQATKAVDVEKETNTPLVFDSKEEKIVYLPLEPLTPLSHNPDLSFQGEKAYKTKSPHSQDYADEELNVGVHLLKKRDPKKAPSNNFTDDIYRNCSINTRSFVDSPEYKALENASDTSTRDRACGSFLKRVLPALRKKNAKDKKNYQGIYESWHQNLIGRASAEIIPVINNSDYFPKDNTLLTPSFLVDFYQTSDEKLCLDVFEFDFQLKSTLALPATSIPGITTYRFIYNEEYEGFELIARRFSNEPLKDVCHYENPEITKETMYKANREETDTPSKYHRDKIFKHIASLLRADKKEDLRPILFKIAKAVNNFVYEPNEENFAALKKLSEDKETPSDFIELLEPLSMLYVEQTKFMEDLLSPPISEESQENKPSNGDESADEAIKKAGDDEQKPFLLCTQKVKDTVALFPQVENQKSILLETWLNAIFAHTLNDFFHPNGMIKEVAYVKVFGSINDIDKLSKKKSLILNYIETAISSKKQNASDEIKAQIDSWIKKFLEDEAEIDRDYILKLEEKLSKDIKDTSINNPDLKNNLIKDAYQRTCDRFEFSLRCVTQDEKILFDGKEMLQEVASLVNEESRRPQLIKFLNKADSFLNKPNQENALAFKKETAKLNRLSWGEKLGYLAGLFFSAVLFVTPLFFLAPFGTAYFGCRLFLPKPTPLQNKANQCQKHLKPFIM